MGSTPEDQDRIDGWLAGVRVEIHRAESKCLFDIQLRVRQGRDETFVRIAGHLTNNEEIPHSIVNMLAINSGMICDGANTQLCGHACLGSGSGSAGNGDVPSRQPVLRGGRE